MQPEVANLPASICVGCGICCDGTLHPNARVRPGDEEGVLAAGLEIIVQDDGKQAFPLPCPHVRCGSCSIYAARPNVCRTYRCALLKGAEAGEVSVDDARRLIGRAHSLLGAIRTLRPEVKTQRQRFALARELESNFAELGSADRELLLNVAALEFLLEGHFRDTRRTEGAAG